MLEPGAEILTQNKFVEELVETGLGWASHVQVDNKGISAAFINNDGLSRAEVAIFDLDGDGNYQENREPKYTILLKPELLGEDEETIKSSLEEISDMVKRLMKEGIDIEEIKEKIAERYE